MATTKLTLEYTLINGEKIREDFIDYKRYWREYEIVLNALQKLDGVVLIGGEHNLAIPVRAIVSVKSIRTEQD